MFLTQRHENIALLTENKSPLILENRLGPLHMQKELVDGCEGISRTAAGEGFNSELNSSIEERQQETRVLGNDTKRALKDKDEETWR